MKHKIFIILLLILFQNCKNDEIIIQPKNELQKFSKVKEQIYDLDTLSFSEIKGKKGTIIFFNRNDFNVNKNSKVKVILKEYYDFKELIYNNINTVTLDNKLLESSGVIYLKFISEGKKIKLKKNKFIEIKIPNKNLEENKLFYAKMDTIKPIKWLEDRTKFKKVTLFNPDYGIYLEFLIPVDSLDVYNKILEKEMLEYKQNIENIEKAEKLENYASFLITQKYNEMNLMNFDKFIKSKINLISFDIELKNKSIKELYVYVIYKNRKSFISYSMEINNDKFKFIDIPYINNQTDLLIIGSKNGKLLYNIIEIKEKPDKIFKVRLKKYNKDRVENLIKR